MQNNLFSSGNKLSLFNIENDYILFEIAEELYAVKLLNVKEIVSNRNIIEVDDLPDFVKGFANIRNVIFPIFDLKKSITQKNIKEYGKYSVIIIFEEPMENLALLADSVLDIYNIPKENFKNSTGYDEKYCNFIDYEVDLNNRVVKVINTEKIIRLKHQM